MPHLTRIGWNSLKTCLILAPQFGDETKDSKYWPTAQMEHRMTALGFVQNQTPPQSSNGLSSFMVMKHVPSGNIQICTCQMPPNLHNSLPDVLQ